jgi:REP element-mobilizing transposase RayT
MSKTSCLYHIVICTRNRKPTITESYKRELYAYIFGIIKAKNCKLIRINGIANHIHILVDLNPTIALSVFVQELKRSSSAWLQASPLFPLFEAWGHEYCAFSKSTADKTSVVEYIKNQEVHHKVKTFEDEMTDIGYIEGFEWQARYFD